MTKSKLRAALTAALPVLEVRQPTASLASYSVAYGSGSVEGVSNADPAASGNAASQVVQTTLKEASDAVTRNNAQMAELLSLQQQLLASTNQNTQALNENTQSKSRSALSDADNALSGILGSGSILSPIVSGIMSLFRGSDSPPQTMFTAFTPPSPVDVETSVTGAVNPPAIQSPVSSASKTPGELTGANVQIQVNAMDSRSFLDHKDEIAEAVRHALLNSHALGDVIAEL